MSDCYHPLYPDFKLSHIIQKKPKPARRRRLKRILMEYFGAKCLCCKHTKRPLTFDHIVPRSKGGRADIDNGQLLCEPCNTKKKDRIKDFRPYVLDFL